MTTNGKPDTQPEGQGRGAAFAGKFIATILPVIALILFCKVCWAQGNETAQFFKQNCASCHTIGGGRITGPDLKGVTQKRDREWLSAFILNPKAKLDAGDPDALALLEEARGVVMPTLPGLTPEKVNFLLELIDAESALEQSQFKGATLSLRPFTPKDAEVGRNLFTGKTALANGGPPCISCHSIPGLGLLGGGNLGPDLTRVYERLQGPTALSAWLNAPATPIMQSVFKAQALQPEEIHSLLAMFADIARKNEPGFSVAQLNFSILGLIGAALVLIAFDHFWKGRFRAVRRPLVHQDRV